MNKDLIPKPNESLDELIPLEREKETEWYRRILIIDKNWMQQMEGLTEKEFGKLDENDGEEK